MKRILLSLFALALIAVGSAYAVNITGINDQNRSSVVNVGYLRMSVTDTITALSGGGQTGAVLLVSSLNRVTTVAAGNDSVMLPLCQNGQATAVGGNPKQAVKTIGQIMYVVNAAASNSMNVYPSVGDGINALGANAAYAMAANKTAAFVCASAGLWYSLLGS